MFWAGHPCIHSVYKEACFLCCIHRNYKTVKTLIQWQHRISVLSFLCRPHGFTARRYRFSAAAKEGHLSSACSREGRTGEAVYGRYLYKRSEQRIFSAGQRDGRDLPGKGRECERLWRLLSRVCFPAGSPTGHRSRRGTGGASR